jgi:predicted acyl esterase
MRQFAAARSSRSLLSQVHTPVLLMQGRRDFAFDIEQATAGYRLLKGPKQLYIGDFGHSPSTFPGPDFNAMMAVGQSWFQRWLLHAPLRPYPPIAVAPNPWRGRLQAYKTLPATRGAHFSFGGTNTVTGVAKADRSTGRTHTTLETFGAARVHLTARVSGGWERLVAVLTATTPKHQTIVVSEGGMNTTGLRGKHRLTIKLISDATLIPKGSTLSLTLASNSLAQNPGNLLYLDLPQPPAAKITLGPARLDLPVLKKRISR